MNEKHELAREKQDLLIECRQLQQLTKQPITSKARQELTKKEGLKKKVRQQAMLVSMIWQDIRKYAERLRKARGDLRALN